MRVKVNSAKEKEVEVKRTAPSKVVEIRPSGEGSFTNKASNEKPKSKSAREGDADLNSGMELLELDFLLGIVENAKGDDEKDVTMRKLNFNELLRRQKQDQIDSNALTVYAVNKGDLYGKDIQCEAMKELTKRTATR